jgi:O-antigen/teichoic acid export membrane protein
MGTTFIPLASGLDASGRSDDLQKLLLRGTQAALGLVLPICVTLLLRGKTFIGLWMGHQYSEVSGTILQILIVSQFFTIANSTAGQIAYGIDKHKSVAKSAIVEAAINLSLSIVLVKTVGVYGVAWGTTLSMALVHLAFWPLYVRKTLGVSIRKYLWEGWTKITLCAVPFGIVCAIADKYWHAASLVTFFGQVLATLPVYAIVVLLIFRREAGNIFQKWQGSRLARAQVSS